MEEITYEKAVELAQNAVNERGADWVYPDEWKMLSKTTFNQVCKYADDNGCPCCIVGHVAWQLGILDQIEEDVDARDVLENTELVFSQDAIDLLCYLQNFQDAGHSWGRSLECAIKEVNNDGV